MKKLFLLLLAISCLQHAHAQIPDDTNGRLYRLCKTWGYFKYFSQKKCTLKWDTLLNTTINQVLLSTNNAEFNNALMGMFNKVGNNSLQANPPSKPDTNINVNSTWINDPVFSQPVSDFLNTFSSYIYPDTSTCFIKYSNYPRGYYSYIDFRNDPLSMSENYANEANRLTTMFYYWNVINYFFPYRNIMDQPWDITLYQFIPLIRQATTLDNFHKTFLKLVTKINDTHGFTDSPLLSQNFWKGTYRPKTYFKRVENKCVVTKVQDVAGVKPGDILTGINGISIRQIEDSLSHFVPASTPAALYRDIYYNMIRGTLNSSINFSFLDSTNNSYNSSATRTETLSAWYNWLSYDGSTLSYYITSCGYGYVNMGKLQQVELSAMYTALKNTPAIILDLRFAPNVDLSELAKLFFRGPIKSAIYFDPALTSVYDNLYYLPGWYYKYDDSNNLGSWVNTNVYNGKVYILVNEETQSYMEYDCQYLSYHPKSKVIGTQTAGADGNVSYLILPGGLYTYFTSLGWYYADGYQQQRNGVKIDSIVSLTIAGIRQRKDEILNAALDCITEVENVPVHVPQQIALLQNYPNPFNPTTTIKFDLPNNSKVQLNIYNLLGEKVAELVKGELEAGHHKVDWNASNFPSGVYFYEISANDFHSVKKMMVIK